MNPYSGPMQPWPRLESLARTLRLPGSGLTLFFYDSGTTGQPALLLIHGLGDEADTWRHLILPLSAKYRVLAPDLPGFGRSDKPAVAYTSAFFQQTLLEWLDALQVSRATWTGHSLGAVIAQSAALAHPERVERLVLISGSLAMRARPDLATMLFLVPGLWEYLYNRLRRDPQAAYRSLESFYSQLNALPEADRQFLYQRVNERVWSDGQRRAFFSTLRSLARAATGLGDVRARLARMQVPTTVIWGEADRINPIQNGRTAAEWQPGAQWVAIPGAGHNVQQERPEAVLQAILERS